MRTRALAILMLMALFLLSACTGGSGQDPDGGASGSPSTEGAASSTYKPVPEAVPENEGILDPCTMMSREYVESQVPEARRGLLVYDRELGSNLTLLTASDKTRYTCTVSFADTGKNVLEWGYFPEAFSRAKIEGMLNNGAGGTDVTQKMGFPAALSGDFLSTEAYALMVLNDVGVFIFIDEKVGSVMDPKSRTSDKTMLAHLRELGQGGYYAPEQRPIETPSYCPTARSSDVKAAFGRVDVARGARDSDGKIWCLYRNEKDFSNLTLTAIQPAEDDEFDILYDAVKNASGKMDLIEGPNGVLTSVSIGNDGMADLQFVDPNQGLYLGANIHYVSSKVRPRRDQAALVALTEAFEALAHQP